MIFPHSAVSVRRFPPKPLPGIVVYMLIDSVKPLSNFVKESSAAVENQTRLTLYLKLFAE